MKNTKSKQIVLQILEGANEAFSAADILAKTNGECDKVTIYRILERLENEGIIHKIVNFDGITKYAKCASNCETAHHHDDHLHFSCTECGKVECLEEHIPPVKIRGGYTVNETVMNLKGICPDCNGSRANS